MGGNIQGLPKHKRDLIVLAQYVSQGLGPGN